MTQKKKPEDLPKMGAPTKYKPEFCQMLVKHFQEGLSFESFAGVAGVARSTLYEWLEQFPDFSDTKKSAESLSLLWWEKVHKGASVGIETMIDGHPTDLTKANMTGIIFGMKNRFSDLYRERHDINHTGSIKLEDVIAGSIPKDDETK